MTYVDQLVLEWFDDTGATAPPKVVYVNLVEEYGEEDTPSLSQINRRMREHLAVHGLIEQPHEDLARGYYTLSELGERYLHDPDAELEEFIVEAEEDGREQDKEDND